MSARVQPAHSTTRSSRGRPVGRPLLRVAGLPRFLT